MSNQQIAANVDYTYLKSQQLLLIIIQITFLGSTLSHMSHISDLNARSFWTRNNMVIIAKTLQSPINNHY